MDPTGSYSHVSQQDYERIAGPDWPTWLDFCEHKGVGDFVYAELDAMLVRPVKFEHPSFCVLPFYALEYWAGGQLQTPSCTFCCLVPDGADRNTVKQHMLAGRRPKECEACWTLEDQGLVSDRLIKNRNIDSDQLAQIQQLLTNPGAVEPEVRHYKIDANNTCNSTCVVCNSTYSTAWAQLERKHGHSATPAWQISTDTLDNTVDYATAASVGFRGGEPMLSDQTWHVLEKLLAAGNTDCFISFTTNGSIPLTQEQKHIIGQFGNVNFNFSIDGVGPVFEYLRYPLQWSDLQRNMQYCRDHNIMITASYTISNLNILYHDQTREWFENQGMDYSLNPVYSPSYFRPAALPETVKARIRQQHPNDKVTAGLLAQHTAQDQLDYELFRNKIAQQDSWKGIKMQDYLPELTDLLG